MTVLICYFNAIKEEPARAMNLFQKALVSYKETKKAICLPSSIIKTRDAMKGMRVTYAIIVQMVLVEVQMVEDVLIVKQILQSMLRLLEHL